jgi:hypothetical protein
MRSQSAVFPSCFKRSELIDFRGAASVQGIRCFRHCMRSQSAIFELLQAFEID